MAHTGRRTQKGSTARRRRTTWIAAGGVAALAVVVALVVLARPPEVAPVTSDGEPTLGAADAPVTVFYYGDFQCSHCQDFEAQEFPALKARWIDTGQVRYVAKDFPILGPDSVTSARASQYVWETAPESYWDWHRELFALAAQGNRPTPDLVVAFTQQRFPDIDAEGMRAAMRDAGAIAAEVNDDHDVGQAHGVSSTPTLLIGGEPVAGRDAAAVNAAIERELANAGAK